MGSGPSGGTSTASVPPVVIPSPTATGAPTVVPSRELPIQNLKLDEQADLEGVVVRVTKLESVDGVAEGPGEVAGPAIRTTVTVTNNTDEAVPLAPALVNLYYGADKTPAGELSGPNAAPFEGVVEPGATVTGQNVFAVPADSRGRVTVEVFISVDVPILQFTGAA